MNERPFTDETIQVFTYKTLAECTDACWGNGGILINGCESDGRPYTMTRKKAMTAYRKRKCWGFCRGKSEVHLWIGKKATKEQVIGLIAHELGHMARPFRQETQAEEIKAGRYEKIAKTAYNIATDLLTPGQSDTESEE